MIWTDFLLMPPGVKILVMVMFWPIFWAGGLAIFALAGDVTGLREKKSPVGRVVSDSR